MPHLINKSDWRIGNSQAQRWLVAISISRKWLQIGKKLDRQQNIKKKLKILKSRFKHGKQNNPSKF